MRGRAGPVTEISVTGMKFSDMNTPACGIVAITVSKRKRSGLRGSACRVRERGRALKTRTEIATKYESAVVRLIFSCLS